MTITSDIVESIQRELACCTGSEEFYRHWTKRLRYTEGVETVQQRCGACWLTDAIASYQTPALDAKCDGFQVWTLKHNPEPGKPNRAVLTCKADSDKPEVVRQVIEFTDFPLPDGIKLYVEGVGTDRCLLLPSEH